MKEFIVRNRAGIKHPTSQTCKKDLQYKPKSSLLGYILKEIKFFKSYYNKSYSLIKQFFGLRPDIVLPEKVDKLNVINVTILKYFIMLYFRTFFFILLFRLKCFLKRGCVMNRNLIINDYLCGVCYSTFFIQFFSLGFFEADINTLKKFIGVTGITEIYRLWLS
jgi:hypothetical protein